MNANDCSGFENIGSFLEAAQNWAKFNGKVTYLLVCGRQICRLQSSSDILYVGQSINFGGNVNSRLWNYHNPGKNTQEGRIKQIVRKFAEDGITVSLHTCQEPPDRHTVQEYETRLLSRYEAEHYELPPLNHRR